MIVVYEIKLTEFKSQLSHSGAVGLHLSLSTVKCRGQKYLPHSDTGMVGTQVLRFILGFKKWFGFCFSKERFPF
jgi:hypothetical protein